MSAERGRRYSGRDMDIDHIWPYSRGGSNTEDNLRVVERSRNRRKGAKRPNPGEHQKT